MRPFLYEVSMLNIFLLVVLGLFIFFVYVDSQKAIKKKEENKKHIYDGVWYSECNDFIDGEEVNIISVKINKGIVINGTLYEHKANSCSYGSFKIYPSGDVLMLHYGAGVYGHGLVKFSFKLSREPFTEQKSKEDLIVDALERKERRRNLFATFTEDEQGRKADDEQRRKQKLIDDITQ